jgi:hypothetical protein
MTMTLTRIGTTGSPDGFASCRSRDGLGTRAIHIPTWPSAGPACPVRPATTRRSDPDGRRAWSADDPEREPGGTAASLHDRRRLSSDRGGTGRDAPQPDPRPDDRGGARGERAGRDTVVAAGPACGRHDHRGPPLARVPLGRHRPERLHAPVLARVEPWRSGRDRPEPRAPPGHVRPRRSRYVPT